MIHGESWRRRELKFHDADESITTDMRRRIEKAASVLVRIVYDRGSTTEGSIVLHSWSTATLEEGVNYARDVFWRFFAPCEQLAQEHSTGGRHADRSIRH
jgi:hypothetical protein